MECGCSHPGQNARVHIHHIHQCLQCSHWLSIKPHIYYVNHDITICRPSTTYTSTYVHIDNIHFHICAHRQHTLPHMCTSTTYTSTYVHMDILWDAVNVYWIPLLSILSSIADIQSRHFLWWLALPREHVSIAVMKPTPEKQILKACTAHIQGRIHVFTSLAEWLGQWSFGSNTVWVCAQAASADTVGPGFSHKPDILCAKQAVHTQITVCTHPAK